MSDKDNNPYEAYTVGVSQTRLDEEQREAKRIISSVDVIQDVLDWFDYRIAVYDSLDAIQVDETTDLEDLKLGILLAKKLKSAYETESAMFSEEFRQYIRLKDGKDEGQ